jgi:hypothetical protein
MIDDTSRKHIDMDGSYTCSIIHNTFVCYHNVSDKENNVKITIIITEEEGNNEERNKKEKED